MKRLLQVGLALLLASVAAASPLLASGVAASPARAVASTMRAADFAARCSAQGTVTLTSNTVVSGGVATIGPSTCSVHLAPGIALAFDHIARATGAPGWHWRKRRSGCTV